MIWLNGFVQLLLLSWALCLTFRFIARFKRRTSLADCARSLLMVGGLWLMLLAALMQTFRDIAGDK
jgi:hypothetical protein